jgi:phenylpropionate dioxygenase-like ring-hydroxylating dioxygenase large terminal subunit
MKRSMKRTTKHEGERMSYLKNAWYVAAWSDSVNREMRVETLLDEPILLYRKQDGSPVAMIDRCPHRFAPLHMGKLLGDIIECGYHGLKFDCSGACVHNPHGDGKIPAAARVHTYPAVDRHNLLWLWNGDAELADPALIPDYSHLTSPLLKTVGDHMIQNAHYELVVDNLMDLSHVNYLHAPYQKVDDFLAAKHDVIYKDGILESKRSLPSTRAPSSFRPFMKDPDAPVEYWLDIRWYPASCCQLEVGIVPVGRPRSEGLVRLGTHIVTPQTNSSTHYFYASSRNYQLDDPAADEETNRWQQMGFHEQDKPMIEGVQLRMGNADLQSKNPILLQTDAAAMRARRILAKLIEKEAGSLADSKLASIAIKSEPALN